MNLNDERKVWLLESLALKDPLVKIKETYTRLFEDRITGEDLIKFQTDNRGAIKKLSEKIQNDIQSEPLAHARTRLRALNDALTYAMTPRATKSVPKSSSGKDIEYEITYEPDYTAIKGLITAAQAEEFFIKKLLLECRKAEVSREETIDLTSSGFEVIQVNDNLKRIGTDGSK